MSKVSFNEVLKEKDWGERFNKLLKMKTITNEDKQLEAFFKKLEKLNLKHFGVEPEEWDENDCICQVWKALRVLRNNYFNE